MKTGFYYNTLNDIIYYFDGRYIECCGSAGVWFSSLCIVKDFKNSQFVEFIGE